MSISDDTNIELTNHCIFIFGEYCSDENVNLGFFLFFTQKIKLIIWHTKFYVSSCVNLDSKQAPALNFHKLNGNAAIINREIRNN